MASKDDRIGLALSFHNLDLLWITVGRSSHQVVDDFQVRLLADDHEPLIFFIAKDNLYCIRTVKDYRSGQRVIFRQHSSAVYDALHR